MCRWTDGKFCLQATFRLELRQLFPESAACWPVLPALALPALTAGAKIKIHLIHIDRRLISLENSNGRFYTKSLSRSLSNNTEKKHDKSLPLSCSESSGGREIYAPNILLYYLEVLLNARNTF